MGADRVTALTGCSVDKEEAAVPVERSNKRMPCVCVADNCLWFWGGVYWQVGTSGEGQVWH